MPSSNAVIIQNGSYTCAIIIDNIHEWPATQFKGAMQQMAKGGKINEYTVEFLSEWFPGAIRDAKSWWLHASFSATPTSAAMRWIWKQLLQRFQMRKWLRQMLLKLPLILRKRKLLAWQIHG